MAKKSKTQRAKASAARAARKEQAKRAAETQAQEAEKKDSSSVAEPEEPQKKGLFKKSASSEGSSNAESGKQASASKDAKKDVKKEKKPGRIKTFFKGVRSEMHRVTWPTRQDVIRWSGVVVVALLFFGVFVAVLDNLIVTPVLLGVSSLSGLLG